MDDTDTKEAKRLCVCEIAEQLKKWASLEPTAREKFMIGQVCDAFGWDPETYVELGFDKRRHLPVVGMGR